jgi:hypothetical protein
MKNISLFLILGWSLFTNFQSLADLIAPANINIIGTGQDLWNRQVGAKTNIDGASTNYTYFSRSTTTNFIVNADWLLNLLTDSYATNFPPESKLVLCGGDGSYYFAVSDGTGTNIIFNPNQDIGSIPVFSRIGQGRVQSGIMIKSTTNYPSISFTGTDSESFTDWILFEYDDSALNTGNGKHANFYWSGRVEVKAKADIGTSFVTENVTIYLTGGGQFPSPYPVSFRGTIRAKLSGVEPFP